MKSLQAIFLSLVTLLFCACSGPKIPRTVITPTAMPPASKAVMVQPALESTTRASSHVVAARQIAKALPQPSGSLTRELDAAVSELNNTRTELSELVAVAAASEADKENLRRLLADANSTKMSAVKERDSHAMELSKMTGKIQEQRDIARSWTIKFWGLLGIFVICAYLRLKGIL